MARYLRIDEIGKAEEIHITGGVDDQLRYIRVALGCTGFEGLRCAETIGCYFDEDGRRKSLAPNPIATGVVRELLSHVGRRLHADAIRGPVLFYGCDDDGDAVDVPAIVERTVAAVRQMMTPAGGV